MESTGLFWDGMVEDVHSSVLLFDFSIMYFYNNIEE